MKNILQLTTLVLLPYIFVGCCNSGSEPGPPYGPANDVSTYDGGDGYKSIDYTYYCKNGKYISVTYVRKDECSNYNKDSEFTSSGICGYNKLTDQLRGLSGNDQRRILIDSGHKIDTLYRNGSRNSGIVEP